MNRVISLQTMNASALNYGLTRRLVARDTVFNVSPRVAKHASDKRATCPLESFACRKNKKCFCCLPETFACLLLQILSRTTKFPRWLNWETSRGHQCRARHAYQFSQAWFSISISLVFGSRSYRGKGCISTDVIQFPSCETVYH